MIRKLKAIGLGLVVAGGSSLALSSTAFADNYRFYGGGKYEVTITNLTYRQVFSPVLVASHRPSIRLFNAAEPASAGIEAIAENGDVSVQVAAVEGDRRVRGAGVGTGPIGPGQSETVVIDVNGGSRVSAVSMLVNSNDAFLGLNTVRGPRYRGQTFVYDVVAYDSGTEANDELRDSIPGPCCDTGVNNNSDDGAEGFIHIHRGIHGVGEIDASVYDWRNPVARITIRRR